MKIRPQTPSTTSPKSKTPRTPATRGRRADKRPKPQPPPSYLADPHEDPRESGRSLVVYNAAEQHLRVSHLDLEWMSIDFLRLPNRVLKSHPENQISKLMGSLHTFGWIAPVLATRSGDIIAGVGRIIAARRLGMTRAPVVFVDHLSSAEIQAYRIADNKLAELSSWEDDVLRDVLIDLESIDFDLDVLGFETAELDLRLNDADDPTSGDPLPGGERNAKLPLHLGDVFSVGAHRVMLGDTLDPDHCAKLMGTSVAAMAFLDFPYNVPISGNVSRKGRHREFAQASGEMSRTQFEDFLTKGLEHAAAHCRPGALLNGCMDWRGIGRLLTAGERAGLEYINLAIWRKNRAGLGSYLRSQHELIAIYRKPGAQHRNNIELGRHGRHRTNVWEYRTPIGTREAADEAVSDHPTPKPWDLVADSVKDCTRRGDVILDFFGGSGASLVAAGKTGRAARIMEIDPIYVGNMLRRYERIFRVEAIHEETGLSLDELAAKRRQD